MRHNEIAVNIWQDYTNKLLDAGYEMIGSGYASEVYAKPGDPSVLKVFDADDYAYRAFHEIALEHRGNPHFPRFGKVARIDDSNMAVVIERLRSYDGEDRLLDDLKMLIWHFQSGQGNGDRLPKVDAQLLDACRIIGIMARNVPTKNGRGRKSGIDMKAANVMMRGETLVFIDPIN